MQADSKHGKSWYYHYFPFLDPSEAAKEALIEQPVMTGKQRRTARRKLERQLNKTR